MNSQLITITRLDTMEEYHFQAVTSFTHSFTSTITTYPTTQGTNHADNIYANPRTIGVGFAIGGNEDTSDEWGSGLDRPKTATALLNFLKDNAIELQIETPQGTWTNMFLTTISLSNGDTNAYNLVGSLSFSELLISTYQTITVGPFESTQTQANDDNTQSDGENNGTPIEISSPIEVIHHTEKSNTTTTKPGEIIYQGIKKGIKGIIDWIKGGGSLLGG